MAMIQRTTERRLTDCASVPAPRRGGLLAGAWLRVRCWQARAAQRRHLAGLDPHLRRDLNLSDAEIARETRKPFWMP